MVNQFYLLSQIPKRLSFLSLQISKDRMKYDKYSIQSLSRTSRKMMKIQRVSISEILFHHQCTFSSCIINTNSNKAIHATYQNEHDNSSNNGEPIQRVFGKQSNISDCSTKNVYFIDHHYSNTKKSHFGYRPIQKNKSEYLLKKLLSLKGQSTTQKLAHTNIDDSLGNYTDIQEAVHNLSSLISMYHTSSPLRPYGKRMDLYGDVEKIWKYYSKIPSHVYVRLPREIVIQIIQTQIECSSAPIAIDRIKFLLNRHDSLIPDQIKANAKLKLLTKTCAHDEINRMFEDYKSSHIPNVETMKIVLEGKSKHSEWSAIRYIQDHHDRQQIIFGTKHYGLWKICPDSYRILNHTFGNQGFTKAVEKYVRMIEEMEGIANNIEKRSIWEWNSLINVNLYAKNIRTSLSLLKQLDELQVPKNSETFEIIFKHLHLIVSSKSPGKVVDSIFEEMDVAGVEPNIIIYQSLLNYFTQIKSLEGVRSVFQKVTQNPRMEPNITFFSAYARSLKYFGYVSDLNHLVEEMIERKVDYDDKILSHLINGYSRKGFLNASMLLQSYLLSQPLPDLPEHLRWRIKAAMDLEPTREKLQEVESIIEKYKSKKGYRFLINHYYEYFLKFHKNHMSSEELRNLFEEIIQSPGFAMRPSVFNLMMDHYYESEEDGLVLELYDRLQSLKIIPNGKTYSCLLLSLIRQQKISMVYNILKEMHSKNLEPSLSVIDALVQIIMVNKGDTRISKNENDSDEHLIQMDHDLNTSVDHHKSKSRHDQENLLNLLSDFNVVKKDLFVYKITLFKTLKLRKLNEAQKILRQLRANMQSSSSSSYYGKLKPDIQFYDIAIYGFALNRDMETCKLLYREALNCPSLKLDTVFFNTFLKACEMNQCYNDVIDIWNEMSQRNCEPDESTLHIFSLMATSVSTSSTSNTQNDDDLSIVHGQITKILSQLQVYHNEKATKSDISIVKESVIDDDGNMTDNPNESLKSINGS